jgi:hypothetical protein
MFFGKKDKQTRKCENCGSKTDGDFSFCPHCGNSFADSMREREDFGLLGRSDMIEGEDEMPMQGFGIMDKLVNSMLNSMMKNLDKQFKSQFKEFADMENAEVRTFPNGIKIKISGPFDAANLKKKQVVKTEKRQIDESQIRRMGSLPRIKAKASVKRLGDRVVYELATPGVTSPQDVFVSKLENGYEIKAIGDKKVYVNSVPINLPLRKYSILKNKLLMEFVAGHGVGEE